MRLQILVHTSACHSKEQISPGQVGRVAASNIYNAVVSNSQDTEWLHQGQGPIIETAPAERNGSIDANKKKEWA